jgi:hypothetical protein
MSGKKMTWGNNVRISYDTIYLINASWQTTQTGKDSHYFSIRKDLHFAMKGLL